jgi:hypothetical protein
MAATRQKDGQTEHEKYGKTQELGSSRKHRYLSDDELDDAGQGVLAQVMDNQ